MIISYFSQYSECLYSEDHKKIISESFLFPISALLFQEGAFTWDGFNECPPPPPLKKHSVLGQIIALSENCF